MALNQLDFEQQTCATPFRVLMLAYSLGCFLGTVSCVALTNTKNKSAIIGSSVAIVVATFLFFAGTLYYIISHSRARFRASVADMNNFPIGSGNGPFTPPQIHSSVDGMDGSFASVEIPNDSVSSVFEIPHENDSSVSQIPNVSASSVHEATEAIETTDPSSTAPFLPHEKEFSVTRNDVLDTTFEIPRDDSNGTASVSSGDGVLDIRDLFAEVHSSTAEEDSTHAGPGTESSSIPVN